MEKQVADLLPLAAKIAREFSNIPGLPHAEIDLAAQEALANAARLFDPAKGGFPAYAARAMRNALRDLYDRQLHHLQVQNPDATTLYHLLTGKFPYCFDPKRDPIDIILNENPVPIRDRLPGLAREIATTIDQSLVRNPKDRFPDAGKLLASLA